MLGLAQKKTGSGLIGTRWQRESCGHCEACELRRIPDVFQHALDATVKGRPIEVRRASDAPEGEDEAVGHGCAEKHFRRPRPSGTVEFRPRCHIDGRHGRSADHDPADGSGSGGCRVMVWKRFHYVTLPRCGRNVLLISPRSMVVGAGRTRLDQHVGMGRHFLRYGHVPIKSADARFAALNTRA